MKIYVAFAWKMIIQSGHNFAHATTAELSWHVQNCDMIGSFGCKLEKKRIFFRVELWAHKLYAKWVPGWIYTLFHNYVTYRVNQYDTQGMWSLRQGIDTQNDEPVLEWYVDCVEINMSGHVGDDLWIWQSLRWLYDNIMKSCLLYDSDMKSCPSHIQYYNTYQYSFADEWT